MLRNRVDGGMKFKNAVIYGDDCQFRRGGFATENGLFQSFADAPDAVDLGGAYVLPGLIDIHIHGAMGEDFSDAEHTGLTKIAEYLAANGITSFAPASMTMPVDKLLSACQAAVNFHKLQPSGVARIMGINLEGPFLSREKRGAQSEEHLVLPDRELFEWLFQAGGGLLKIVCIAPELPGALDLIQLIRRRCTVSMAHTAADYETAKKAIASGVTQVTHLFNGMPPLLHRAPGVIGAAAESASVSAELICDGYHVHESVIRAAFTLFSPERIILISDALSCLGMPDGIYGCGGQTIRKKNGFAVLEDGVTFAGSSANLHQCMKKAISFGIKPEDAIRAATINPARAIGADDEIGSISPGKWADYLICDKEFNIKQCYIGGKLVRIVGNGKV